MQGRMYDPKAILAFMTAGKATVTIKNALNGNRFTYKIKLAPKRQPSDPDTWFVQLLNGPDNNSDYIYIGILRNDGVKLTYKWTAKARVGEQTPSVKAFKFAMDLFTGDNVFPPSFEVYHEGMCGRCGRKLTVPESITSGFGPECINLVGFGAVSRMQTPVDTPVQSDFGFRGGNRATKTIGGYAATKALYAPAKKVKRGEVAPELDRQIRVKIAEYKAEAPENYYQDGEVDDHQAFRAAYEKFRRELQAGVR